MCIDGHILKNKKGHRITMALGSFYNLVDEMCDNVAHSAPIVKSIIPLFLKKSI